MPSLIQPLFDLSNSSVAIFEFIAGQGLFKPIHGLAQIDSLAGIASPAVLVSFALLGIAPWIAKAIIGWIKRRKAYSGFTRPKSFDRNLVVIGAGAAGLVSALIAAPVKAKVTLVEANKMGGDCLDTGSGKCGYGCLSTVWSN